MALRQLGLKKDNWFAVVHLREIGYEHRRGVSQERTVNPLDYLPALNRIIEKHGGQVVRVGDPSMTPLPPTAGLIDLSRIPDSFPLQAFALARPASFSARIQGRRNSPRPLKPRSLQPTLSVLPSGTTGMSS